MVFLSLVAGPGPRTLALQSQLHALTRHASTHVSPAKRFPKRSQRRLSEPPPAPTATNVPSSPPAGPAKPRLSSSRALRRAAKAASPSQQSNIPEHAHASKEPKEPLPATVPFHGKHSHAKPNKPVGNGDPRSPLSLGLLKHVRKVAPRTPLPALASLSEGEATAVDTPAALDTPPADTSALDYIPLLPAPPDARPTHDQLSKLRAACQRGHLGAAIRYYGLINDWQSMDQITEDDWNGISLLISREMVRKASPQDLVQISEKRPDLYGLLMTMALEAAARDKWDGLFRIMLALIRSGRPQEVTLLFRRYQVAIRGLQGRKEEHLHSFDRETRLRARVEAEGYQPLTTVNIAALSMLQQLNSANVIAMLGSNTNWQRFDLWAPPVEKALRESPGHGDHPVDLRNALQIFFVGLLCHHTSALLDRIRSLHRSESWPEFMRLYQTVLDTTYGPDRLIRPLDLDAGDQLDIRRNEIVLPRDVWLSFMQGFCDFARPDLIFRLIDVEFGRRKLPAGAFVLGKAIDLVSVMTKRATVTPLVQESCFDYIDQLLKYAEDRGLDDTDPLRATKFRLASFGKQTKEVQALFDNFHAVRYRDVGPLTRAALVSHLLSQKRIDRALEVLLWTGGPSTEPNHSEPYIRFVREIFHPQFSTKEREMGLSAAMKHKPKDLIIPYKARGALLSHRIALHGNVDKRLEEAYTGLYRDPHGYGGVWPSFKQWVLILEGLLTHSTYLHHTTPLEAEAGLKLLAKTFEVSPGVTNTRANRIWTTYVLNIARTDKIPAAQRQRYIQQASDLLPPGLGPPDIPHRFRLIAACLSRSDDEGLVEAIGQWETIRQDPYVHPRWWSELYFAFQRSGRSAFAFKLVEGAWNGRTVNPYANFWDEMLAKGTLNKLNISRGDLERWRVESNLEKAELARDDGDVGKSERIERPAADEDYVGEEGEEGEEGGDLGQDE